MSTVCQKITSTQQSWNSWIYLITSLLLMSAEPPPPCACTVQFLLFVWSQCLYGWRPMPRIMPLQSASAPHIQLRCILTPDQGIQHIRLSEERPFSSAVRRYTKSLVPLAFRAMVHYPPGSLPDIWLSIPVNGFILPNGRHP